MADMNFALNTSSKSVALVLTLLFVLFGIGLCARTLNASYFLLLLTSICVLIASQGGPTLKSLYRSAPLLHWGMSSMLVALIVIQIAHGHFDASPYNSIARLATFILMLALFRPIPLEKLTLAKWSFVVGAVSCAIQIYFLPRLDGRPDIENWYIAMAGLLGTFSVISLAWEKRPGALAIIGHVVGGVCGLYVIFVSQTRGVWIAIPAFMFLTFLTYVKNAMSLKKIATFVVLCGLAGAIFFNTDIAKGRIAQAKSDIQVFEVNNNADTSVGVRFQLWHTAWLMIQEHPVIGVGAGDEYKAALTDMVDRKVLPTFYNGAHSHNEVLFSTVTMGIFGLIAILMTYFVPAYYFGRHILHTDRQVRASAALGLSVCFGFFIIGSVDVLFKYKETAVIYCVASALFYACLSTRLAQLNHTDAALQ